MDILKFLSDQYLKEVAMLEKGTGFVGLGTGPGERRAFLSLGARIQSAHDLGRIANALERANEIALAKIPRAEREGL